MLLVSLVLPLMLQLLCFGHYYWSEYSKNINNVMNFVWWWCRTHFHLQSDQAQIIDLLRWVRTAHNVSTWLSPWPERTAMSLGPTEWISWEQIMNDFKLKMWGLVDITGIILICDDGLNQCQGAPSWVAKQASRWQAWVEQVLGRGGNGCKLHVLQLWGD